MRVGRERGFSGGETEKKACQTCAEPADERESARDDGFGNG